MTDDAQTRGRGAGGVALADFRRLATVYLPYLITAGIVLFLLLQGEKFWMSNDDIRMSMTVGGYGIAAAPSPDLVLECSVVWGWVVQHLPDMAGIRAYTLATYLLFLGSGLAVLYVLQQSKAPSLFAAATLLGMYCTVILLPQFTLLAGYLAAAGFALVFNSGQHNLRRSMAAAAFFLILAGLVRPDELGLVFLVVTPFLLQAWWTRSWSWRWHWLGLGVACGLVLGAAFLFNLHYSSTGAWRDYADISDISGEFVDYHVGSYLIRHPDELARAHVSLNDIKLMNAWFFLDPKVFNSANFGALADSMTLMDRAAANTNQLRSLLPIFRSPGFQILMALFALFSALNWRRCLPEVASFTVLLLLMVGISLYGRPGELRIWLPAAAAMTTLSLLRLRQRDGILILVLGIAALLGALHDGATIYNDNAEAAVIGRHARAVTCALVPEDRLVLVWGAEFKYPWKEIYRPFTRDDDPCNPKLYAIGSYQLAPPSLAQLYAATDGKNLIDALLGGQEFYIVTSENKLKMLDTYLQEHYKAGLRWQQVTNNPVFTAFTIRASSGS